MTKLVPHIVVLSAALIIAACGGSSASQNLAGAATDCQSNPQCAADLAAALANSNAAAALTNANSQIPTSATAAASQVAAATGSSSSPVVTLNSNATPGASNTMNATDILNQKTSNNFEKLSNYFGDKMQGKAATEYSQSDSPAADGAK